MLFFRTSQERRPSTQVRQNDQRKKPKQKRGCRGGFKIKKKKRTVGEGIYNISRIELTKAELTTLDKGLKYAPTRNFNKFEMYVDIQKYTRKLNIKKYMLTKPPNIHTTELDTPGRIIHSNLRNKSLFNPPAQNNEHIEVFNRMVTQELNQLKFKRIYEP